jgi:hypothetical protein
VTAGPGPRLTQVAVAGRAFAMKDGCRGRAEAAAGRWILTRPRLEEGSEGGQAGTAAATSWPRARSPLALQRAGTVGNKGAVSGPVLSGRRAEHLVPASHFAHGSPIQRERVVL